jgi:acetoin utilization protein AcuB
MAPRRCTSVDGIYRRGGNMFVSNSMTTQLITIAADASILEAQRKMAEHNIRHLPVTKGEDILLGMVTDRDIRSAIPYDFNKDLDQKGPQGKVTDLCVRDIMTRDLMTISPLDTIQDALLLIQRAKVGALPVVEEGKLKGILSVRDLMRAFINVLGIGEPGTLLGIQVPEKVGVLKQIVDAITEEKISFGSVLVARYREEGKRAVFPYVLTNNVAPIKKKIEGLGFKLIDPMKWYIDQLPKNE